MLWFRVCPSVRRSVTSWTLTVTLKVIHFAVPHVSKRNIFENIAHICCNTFACESKSDVLFQLLYLKLNDFSKSRAVT